MDLLCQHKNTTEEVLDVYGNLVYVVRCPDCRHVGVVNPRGQSRSVLRAIEIQNAENQAEWFAKVRKEAQVAKDREMLKQARAAKKAAKKELKPDDQTPTPPV